MVRILRKGDEFEKHEDGKDGKGRGALSHCPTLIPYMICHIRAGSAPIGHDEKSGAVR